MSTLKGRKQTPEHIRKRAEKVRLALTGRKLSGEHKAKIKAGAPKGENNHNWKGNKVGYSALHDWVKLHKPKPVVCEDCHKNSPTQVANISGEYKRDLNDYRWICRECHITRDHLNEKARQSITRFNQLPRTKEHIQNCVKSRYQGIKSNKNRNLRVKEWTEKMDAKLKGEVVD